ncbi:DUF523 domain-containing protein [Deinococcus fonticola]|uniref:DUF523 domain-containing protein n=1 Tax=Deinococcus fonticola TaxID=2528713 RepID=UPI001074A9B1|nr:DUF523 domain-containing protein [Deinococcus fonticola]
MERILVSACLLGERVRYDGRAAAWEPPALWLKWQRQGRLLPFCAECAAGFAVPRPKAERLGKQVVEQTGADVTADFRRGAELTLAFAHRHSIRLAVLKEKSPSCGVNIIYDGFFSGRQITGEGVVAALLRQHGIQVFSEHELERVQPWLEVQ